MHQQQPAPHCSRDGAPAHSRWLLPILLVAQLMVILDITAVNIAMPQHRQGSPHRRRRHQLDDHQLLAHFRQPAAPGRPRRRSPGPPPALPYRPRTIHRVFAAVSDRRVGGRAVRRPRRPGPRSLHALARRPVDHHHQLPRPRPRQGAGCLGRYRWRRRRARRPSRRHPHAGGRLADDLHHQPATRDCARDSSHADHPRRHGSARSGRVSTFAVRLSPPQASPQSFTRSPRPARPAGLHRRHSDSRAPASPASRPSRRASATPANRCCASSGSVTGPSAVDSS